MLENMEVVSDMCPTENVHHVSGNLNPADVATRGNTQIEDIGQGSFWLTGPKFLCSPRDCWPVTREFVRVKIPDEEMRHPGQVITAAVRAVVLQEKSDLFNSILPIKHQVIIQLLLQNNSMESRKRVLALVLRGWEVEKTKEVLSAPVT